MIKIKNIISKINKVVKQRGYYIEGNEVYFIFTAKLYNFTSTDKIDSVELMGSFTAWKDRWQLEKITEGVWGLKKYLSEVNIPGNSGRPEFKFIINSDNIITPPEDLDWKHKFFDGYSHDFKNIILLKEEATAEIEAINQKIINYRINYDSRYQLSNFREITLGQISPKTIYRSYHPFIKSRPDHPLEDKRIATVQQLMLDHNINSVINLSDTKDELGNITTSYQDIINADNIILTNQDKDYDLYYYITDQADFAQLLEEIIKFIIAPDIKKPFLIHCRLGTDRTGVVTAILAAFMGAKWANISADYTASNQLGIKEYRSERLLHYSFQKLLNEEFNDNNLAKLIWTYLKNKTDLTERDLTELKEKLSS